jgi:hypothetical protein
MALFFTACSKPDPNPELKDELFLEFRAQAEESAKIEEAGPAEIKKAQEEINALPINSSNRKILQDKYWDTVRKIELAKQNTKYYRQKMLERQKLVVRRYLISFYSRQPLEEDPSFKEYQSIKKGRQVPRDWDARKRVEHARKPAAPPPASGGH